MRILRQASSVAPALPHVTIGVWPALQVWEYTASSSASVRPRVGLSVLTKIPSALMATRMAVGGQPNRFWNAASSSGVSARLIPPMFGGFFPVSAGPTAMELPSFRSNSTFGYIFLNSSAQDEMSAPVVGEPTLRMVPVRLEMIW